jgi:hypothetical protein
MVLGRARLAGKEEGESGYDLSARTKDAGIVSFRKARVHASSYLIHLLSPSNDNRRGFHRQGK